MLLLVIVGLVAIVVLLAILLVAIMAIRGAVAMLRDARTAKSEEPTPPAPLVVWPSTYICENCGREFLFELWLPWRCARHGDRLRRLLR